MYAILTLFFTVAVRILDLRSWTFEFPFTQRMNFGKTTKVRWRTEVTIVKKQDLWTQPAVGVDPASVGKGCYKVSDHERECNGLIVQFSNFVKLNEDFHYSAPENRGSAGSNRFDKSKAYEIFRLPVAQHRDSSPTVARLTDSTNVLGKVTVTTCPGAPRFCRASLWIGNQKDTPILIRYSTCLQR